MQRFLREPSLSAVVAGFVAVLVGFTSSVAIVFVATQALGANSAAQAAFDVNPTKGTALAGEGCRG